MCCSKRRQQAYYAANGCGTNYNSCGGANYNRCGSPSCNRCGGPSYNRCGGGGCRRTPILVTLGKKAYDKYQERKQLREAETSAINRASSPPPEKREASANAEILQKAGIAPPDYEDVVKGEKSGVMAYEAGKEVDVSDEEEFYEVVDGHRVLDPDFAAHTLSL